MSFKIPNTAAKCSRSLFYYKNLKVYDVYTINFLIIYNIISVFYFLLRKEFPYAILM